MTDRWLQFLCGLAIAMNFAIPPVSASPSAAVLKSPLLNLVDDFVREAVSATPEWRALEIRRNTIRAQASGLEIVQFDREVMSQLREIQDIVEARRRMTRSPRPGSERELVEVLAHSKLQMAEDLADLSRGADEILTSERYDLVGLARASVRGTPPAELQFLRKAQVDPIFSAPQGLRIVSEAEYQAAVRLSQSGRPPMAALSAQAREARTWFSRLDHCVRTSPVIERTNRQQFFFASDLAQSLSITAFGYIAGAGEHKVDWSYLPVDLALTVFDKWAGSKISFGRSSFRVRYMWATFYNEARVALDAAVYVIKPDDEQTIRERLPMAQARSEWGTIWNASSTISSTTLSTILGGLECFSPSAGTRTFVSMVRLGNSLARSFFFYHGRQMYLDHDLSER